MGEWSNKKGVFKVSPCLNGISVVFQLFRKVSISTFIPYNNSTLMHTDSLTQAHSHWVTYRLTNTHRNSYTLTYTSHPHTRTHKHTHIHTQYKVVVNTHTNTHTDTHPHIATHSPTPTHTHTHPPTLTHTHTTHTHPHNTHTPTYTHTPNQLPGGGYGRFDIPRVTAGLPTCNVLASLWCTGWTELTFVQLSSFLCYYTQVLWWVATIICMRTHEMPHWSY